jgi:hypothetical protein
LAVIDLLRALTRVGERNSAEIARVMASYFHARDEFEPVSRKELLDRLRCGSGTVLDVRPEDEFKMGHLPSALNIPLAQLEQRLARVAHQSRDCRLLPWPVVRAVREQLIQGLLVRVPIRQEAVDAPIQQPATAPDTSAEKLTRLLTWMGYRMAVSHIAEIYRLLVETIEQILRKA